MGVDDEIDADGANKANPLRRSCVPSSDVSNAKDKRASEVWPRPLDFGLSDVKRTNMDFGRVTEFRSGDRRGVAGTSDDR